MIVLCLKRLYLWNSTCTFVAEHDIDEKCHEASMSDDCKQQIVVSE